MQSFLQFPDQGFELPYDLGAFLFVVRIRHGQIEADQAFFSICIHMKIMYAQSRIEDLQEAMEHLGFAAVEEMAIGAEIVSREYERLMMDQERDVLISSVCPSMTEAARLP